MRYLLIGLFALAAFLPGKANAAPREKNSVTRTSRNDGNSRILFAITCSSYAWTVVGSSNTTSDSLDTGTAEASIRRRSMTVQTLTTVDYAVCLSSTSASGDTCADGRPGYELGSAWGSVSIYDEGVWRCRTRTGGTTAIKGVDFYDNRDEVK